MDWKRTFNWIKRNYIILSFIFFTILYFILSSYRHISFGSNSLDLGSYTQTFWLYSHFKDPVNTVLDGRRPLGDHFEPLLMVFSLIYRLIPSPFFLFFLQSIFLASMVIPLGRLMKKYSGNDFITILFILFVGLSFLSMNAILFDFHPLLIIAGLTAWLLYFMENKQWSYMFVTFILMLLLKETIGLWGILLGIYLLLKREKAGVYVIILSILQFIIAEKFVIPYFLGSETYHLRYAELGGSFKEIIFNVIKKPILPFEILTRPNFLLYYLLTVFRFPLAIFDPMSWILALSNFGERFLSSERLYWGDSFHYGILLVPVLSFGTIKGLKFIKEHFSKYLYFTAIPLLVIPILLNVGQMVYGSNSRVRQLSTHVKTRVVDYVKTQNLFNKVPGTSSVSAQDNFVSHFANRDHIYKLTDYEKGEYVILDKTRNTWPLNKEEYNTVYQEVTDDYLLVGRYKTIEVFKKR